MSPFIFLGRILAIDYGQKRIGLAVTDPLQIIATTLDTVERKKIWEYLAIYTKKEVVDSFVVGMPTKMNNQPSESVKYILPFIEELKNKYPNCPVFTMDERFTSKMAVQAMIDGGLKKMARRDKATIDRVSASLILQSFLEKKNRFL